MSSYNSIYMYNYTIALPFITLLLYKMNKRDRKSLSNNIVDLEPVLLTRQSFFESTQFLLNHTCTNLFCYKINEVS